MSDQLEELVRVLFYAHKNSTAIPQLSLSKELTLTQAYAIQQSITEFKKLENQQVSGYKLGFTGESKRIQMGVEDIIIGTLFRSDEIKSGSEVAINHWINPKVEPEIAFLLGKDIDHPLEVSEIPGVIEAVAPALEVADSRYSDFTFNLADVVADNSFSGSYVLGAWKKFEDDLAGVDIKMLIDSIVRQQGTGSAIMGNPLLALKELSRLAAKYNMPLKKGYTILAGAATNAESLRSGMQVKGEFMNLGSVTINIK